MLVRMHRASQAEHEKEMAWIRQHDIQNGERAMLHVYPPPTEYDYESSQNIGFNPMGIDGMNPAPEFNPITAPGTSGYYFPDEHQPTTPASLHQYADDGNTHEHTHADGGSSLLYYVISATLAAAATATGLGIVVHLVNTPELQMIFEAVKKQTSKAKDAEPKWVQGLPAFSFPHGHHGQTPGAPAASSGDQATPQQQAAWAHQAASSSSAHPTYPSGINNVPLPAATPFQQVRPGERPPTGTYTGGPTAAAAAAAAVARQAAAQAAAAQAASPSRPGRPGERPPPSTYAGAPEAAARQATDAAYAALPKVKRTGKLSKEEALEREAILAHATQVAAAASLGQGPNVAAVLAERAARYRAAEEALSKPLRRVRGKTPPPRGGRLKKPKAAPFLPFHDITDDPYFIKV